MLLSGVDSYQQLGEHIGGFLYQKEIDYLIRCEWCMTAEDLLWRRTKYGLMLNQSQIDRVVELVDQNDVL